MSDQQEGAAESSDEPIPFSVGYRVVREQLALHPIPFAVAVFGAFVFAAATVVSAEILGAVVDNLIYPAFRDNSIPRDWMLWGCIGLLAAVVLRSAGVVARRYFAGMTGERVQVTFRTDLTERYLGLPVSWHQRMPSGQLLAHADNDIQRMADVIHPLPFAFGASFLVLFSAISMILVDPILALIAFALFPSLFLANRLYTTRVERPLAKTQEEVGRTSAVAHESFDGALIVKTLGRADAERERFRERAYALRAERVKVGYLRALFESSLDALPNLGIVAVVIVGAYRVDAGAVTRGDLIQVASLFAVLAFPVRVFGFFLEELPPSVVARRRLDLVLDEPVPANGGDMDLPAGPLSVETKGLSFSYPDGSEILRSVDIAIAPGEVVALVGSTGSGKSTLCALLADLVDPTSGQVLLGSVPISEVDAAQRTDAVAVCFQEAFLFGSTVGRNIDLNGRGSTVEVEQAAKVAQAHDFIAELPDGYDTVVGERGVTLSGGQRQRVALARALMEQPRFLILDDSTSAVDPRIEQRILSGLRSTSSDANPSQHAGTKSETTTLIVAQRLATISLADRILYLADGEIAGSGSHSELMKLPGYEALVRAYELAGK